MANPASRLALLALSLLLPFAPSAAQRSGGDRAGGGELRLTFLGTAGWEITDGNVVIVVDPFLSRAALDSIARAWGVTSLTPDSASRVPLPPPDTSTIDAHVRRVDYVLVTHGHLDHAFEAPYLARKRGAVVIGSETVANIARAYGVPDSSLITVVGGEDYEFGTFSVRVIPNIHTALRNKRFYNGPGAGATPRGLTAPLRAIDFEDGGNKAYLLRLAGHEVLIMGSMNFIEREMQELRPDVALIGANAGRRQIHDYTGRLMRALGHPALVLATHCCETLADPEALTFAKEVAAASPRARVVVPELYRTIRVPPRR